MKTDPKTPNRRQSLIDVFQAPLSSKKPTSSSKHQKTPYERPRDRIAAIFRGKDTKNEPRKSNRPPTPIPDYATDMDIDTDSDDEYLDEGNSHTLSAMGDISLSFPLLIPGADGADLLHSSDSPPRAHKEPLSPTTTHIALGFARPRRPAPPARRFTLDKPTKCIDSSIRGWHESRPDTPSSMTSEVTIRPNGHRSETPVSISSEVTIRPGMPSTVAMHTTSRLKFSTKSSKASFGSFSSIGTIPDEPESEPSSTRQSRFTAFMQSRDLTHSPSKKSEQGTGSHRDRLNALAREASLVIGHQLVPSPGRPLRGNAPLPARPPIPRWGTSELLRLNE